MGLFLLTRRAGSTDFDARRALRPRAVLWLGGLVIRAMGTLPRCRMCRRSGFSWQPTPKSSDHYIGEAVGLDCRRPTRRRSAGEIAPRPPAKGGAAYLKFMGECLKEAPA